MQLMRKIFIALCLASCGQTEHAYLTFLAIGCFPFYLCVGGELRPLCYFALLLAPFCFNLPRPSFYSIQNWTFLRIQEIWTKKRMMLVTLRLAGCSRTERLVQASAKLRPTKILPQPVFFYIQRPPDKPAFLHRPPVVAHFVVVQISWTDIKQPLFSIYIWMTGSVICDVVFTQPPTRRNSTNNGGHLLEAKTNCSKAINALKISRV